MAGSGDDLLRRGDGSDLSNSVSSCAETWSTVFRTVPELSITNEARLAFSSEDITACMRLRASSREYPSRSIRRCNCSSSGSQTHHTESQY